MTDTPTPDDLLAELRRLADFHEGKRQYATTVFALRGAVAEVERLRAALRDAADAFEECTGDYAKELAADDLARWRVLAGGDQPTPTVPVTVEAVEYPVPGARDTTDRPTGDDQP